MAVDVKIVDRVIQTAEPPLDDGQGDQQEAAHKQHDGFRGKSFAWVDGLGQLALPVKVQVHCTRSCGKKSRTLNQDQRQRQE